MASDDVRKTLIVAIVVTAVIAVLAGAGGAWLARAAEVRGLEERLASAERRLAEIAEGAGALDSDDTSGAADAGEPTATQPPATDSGPEEPAAAGTGERVPAIVTRVRTAGGTHYVELDYIQFLTGADAAAAAAARGDESPPPNDYYIVNENPRLREFPIQAGIDVQVVYASGGASTPEGLTVSLADWAAAMPGPLGEYYRVPFYWVTVTDGTVSALEQQYLP